jgi:hypothetical protein
MGDFRPGDGLVSGPEIGVRPRLVNYGVDEVNRIKGCRSNQIQKILGYKHSDEIIHRDNLAVTEAVKPEMEKGRQVKEVSTDGQFSRQKTRP